MRHTIYKSAALLTVAASIAVYAGVSEADAPLAPAAPPLAAPDQHDAAPAAAVDRDQLATLGVLRRDEQPTDVVPPSVRTHVADALGPDVGANAGLARRALRTASGEDLFVVPGRGWVCLASSEGAAGCTPTDQIAQGFAVTLQRISTGVRVGGLVPDDVRTVSVHGADGASASAEVDENAWRVDVAFDPTSVTWTRDGATDATTVPITVPAPAPTLDAEP